MALSVRLTRHPEVTVLAVDLASGQRLAGRDIAVVSGLSGAAGKAHGLWSDGVTMWVLFGDAGTAVAFDVLSGQRRPGLDMGFVGRDGIDDARALWSDGSVMWVGDYPVSYSSATDSFTAAGRLVAYYLPTEAALGSLSLTDGGGGEISIGRFEAWDTRYSAFVFSQTDTATVDADAYHPDAAATITPDDADADTPGHQISLDIGANTVTVLAGTAAHTVTYTIDIYRMPLPALTALDISDTALEEPFEAGTTSYVATAIVGTARVTVTAPANDPSATVVVAPEDADAGTDGHQVDLEDTTTITATVTAADGATSRVYDVAVTRPPLPALTALDISDTALEEPFEAGTTSYVATAIVGTARVTVTAPANDPSATVVVAPEDADAGTDGHQVDLEDTTTITATVTAADGATSRVYDVAVTRPPPPALTRLEFTDMTHHPRLEADVSHYTAAVTAGANQVTVTAEPSEPGASVEITPRDADADANGHQIDVGSGDVVVTVTVTAADHVTTRVYTVAIGRDIQPAAAGRVAFSGVDVEFSPAQSRYETPVPQNLTSTSIKLAPSGASALEGFAFTAGDSHLTPIGDDGRVTLTAGRDTLVAVRAASPGHLRERLYTFRLRTPQNNNNSDHNDNGARSPAPGGIVTLSDTVKSLARGAPQTPHTRADDQNADPELTALAVSSGTLMPSFSSAVTGYTLTVPFETSQLTVTPAAPTGTAVTYSDLDADSDTGGHQFALNPTQGGQASQTAVMVIVTQGTSVNPYTITVTRNPASTHEQPGSRLRRRHHHDRQARHQRIPQRRDKHRR